VEGKAEGLQPVVICFNMYLHKLSHIVMSPRLVTYERKLDSKVPTEVTLSVGHKLSFEDNVVILLYIIQYPPNVSLISALSNCPRADHCKIILKVVCFPPIRKLCFCIEILEPCVFWCLIVKSWEINNGSPSSWLVMDCPVVYTDVLLGEGLHMEHQTR
jgi:hypothetical protein